VSGGEAEEAEPAVAEEEFNLDEVMAEDVNELLSKEERLKQVWTCTRCVCFSNRAV
jgi:hypothetical protein